MSRLRDDVFVLCINSQVWETALYIDIDDHCIVEALYHLAKEDLQTYELQTGTLESTAGVLSV